MARPMGLSKSYEAKTGIEVQPAYVAAGRVELVGQRGSLKAIAPDFGSGK